MAGFKDFTDGNTLTGDELDGYLMRQSIMTFASTGDRDSALVSVVANGMFAYTIADDMLWARRGGVWREAWPRYIRRTTDSAPKNNNASASIDDVLQFSAPSNSSYHILGRLWVTVSGSSSTSDLRIGFSVPAGASSNFGGPLPDVGMAATASIASADWTGLLGAVTGTLAAGLDSDGTTYVPVDAWVNVAAAPGTVGLSWAQNTAVTVNTVIKAGSFLRIERAA